jgi:hypothetical protein
MSDIAFRADATCLAGAAAGGFAVEGDAAL